MSNQKRTMFVVLIAAIIIALAIWAPKASKGSSGYSIVYLSTGDAYVGHLSTFWDFELKDGYVLQVLKDPSDPSKNTFQLQPVSEALWAPEVMHINKKNVIFYAPIKADSKIGQALASKEKKD